MSRVFSHHTKALFVTSDIVQKHYHFTFVKIFLNMANTLLNFPKKESFPDNIVDFELDNIERISLKALAFVGIPKHI